MINVYLPEPAHSSPWEAVKLRVQCFGAGGIMPGGDKCVIITREVQGATKTVHERLRFAGDIF